MSASSNGPRLTLREKLELTRPSNPEFQRLAGLTEEEAAWGIEHKANTIRRLSIHRDIEEGKIITKEQADFYLSHSRYVQEVVQGHKFPAGHPALGYFAKRNKFFEEHPELRIEQ